MEGAMAMAKKIASKSQMAAGFVKRSVKGTFEMSETAAIAHERSLFISALATADKKDESKPETRPNAPHILLSPQQAALKMQ